MPDMLVKLYDLPDLSPVREAMTKQNITVRPALPPEKHLVLEWIADTFGQGWVSEADVAFSNQPCSCIIAVDEKESRLIGFACYEATCKNYFGPTGVDPEYRGRGIGRALFLEALYGLKSLGYAYCIIGGAGPVEFYRKTAGAIPIEDSVPGIYKGMLKKL